VCCQRTLAARLLGRLRESSAQQRGMPPRPPPPPSLDQQILTVVQPLAELVQAHLSRIQALERRCEEQEGTIAEMRAQLEAQPVGGAEEDRGLQLFDFKTEIMGDFVQQLEAIKSSQSADLQQLEARVSAELLSLESAVLEQAAPSGGERGELLGLLLSPRQQSTEPRALFGSSDSEDEQLPPPPSEEEEEQTYDDDGEDAEVGHEEGQFYYECSENENLQCSLAEVEELVARGIVSDDTRVWMTGLEDWVPFREARGQLREMLAGGAPLPIQEPQPEPALHKQTIPTSEPVLELEALEQDRDEAAVQQRLEDGEELAAVLTQLLVGCRAEMRRLAVAFTGLSQRREASDQAVQSLSRKLAALGRHSAAGGLEGAQTLSGVVAAVELLAAELDRAAPWFDSDQQPQRQTEPEEGERSLVSRVCKLTRPLITSGAASPL